MLILKKYKIQSKTELICKHIMKSLGGSSVNWIIKGFMTGLIVTVDNGVKSHAQFNTFRLSQHQHHFRDPERFVTAISASLHLLSFKVIQNQTEGKRTWRLGTWETTANARYEGAEAASKKPISHITRPALCTAGDIGQSIAVVAMVLPACTCIGGRTPHDTRLIWLVWISSFAFWSVLLLCLWESWILIPPHSLSVYSRFFFSRPWLLSRCRRNMFSSTHQCSIKASSIAFD